MKLSPTGTGVTSNGGQIIQEVVASAQRRRIMELGARCWRRGAVRHLLGLPLGDYRTAPPQNPPCVGRSKLSCVDALSEPRSPYVIAPWPAGYNAPVDSVPMKAYVCPRAAVGYSRCRENSDPIRSAPEFPKCWCGCSLLRVRLATAAVRFPSKTMPPAHRRQAHPKGLGPRRRRARPREGGSGAHRQRAHANRMAWACWAGCDTG